MKFFKEKIRPVENLTFLGIMCALTLILSVFITLFPIISPILILLVPLISTLAVIYTQNKYFWLYLIATIGLSIVCTIWNFSTTLLFVVPGVLSGYAFGYIIKKKFPIVFAIVIGALFNFGLTLAFIPLINFIYNIDIIKTLLEIFKLENKEYIYQIVPIILFIISLLENFLSFVIIKGELERFKIDLNIYHFRGWIFHLISCFFSLTIIGFYFFTITTGYIVLLISLYFVIFTLGIYIKNHQNLPIIFFVISLIIGIILTSIFYQYLTKPGGLLLMGSTTFLYSLGCFIFELCSSRNFE